MVGGGAPWGKGALTAGALTELGYEVALFDDWNFGFRAYTAPTNALRWLAATRPGVLRRLVGWASARFVARACRFRPDLVLFIRGDRVAREALVQVREATHCRMVNWLSDNVFRLRSVLECLALYDRVFVKDSWVLEELRRAGHDNLDYLGQCCDPLLHRTVELSARQRQYYGSDLAMVGAIYPRRLAVLEAMSDFDLKVWLEFPNLRLPRTSPVRASVVRRRTFGIEQTRVFNAARIVLNTHHEQDIHGVNLRTFEAAGCGAFQTVEWREDLARFFDIGREIVTFRSVEELRDKVRYYLAHSDERQAIGRRAQRRAHAEHTYTRRVERILQCAA